MVLNGEMLHTRPNPRHFIRICPVCAGEDIASNPGKPLDQAVYGRCEWIVGVVDACTKHMVKLVSHRAPLRTAEKLDVGYETGFLLEELRFVTPEPTELDDFQLYVLSRNGTIVPRLSSSLDPLPLVTVTSFAMRRVSMCCVVAASRVSPQTQSAVPQASKCWAMVLTASSRCSLSYAAVYACPR